MLRMTKQADYGIVLLTHMAGSVDDRISSSELAVRTQIPVPTVSKILKILVREGLLESHRGVKGGYSLARPPEAISVATMIAALDGPIAFTECIEDGPGSCSQEPTCGIRDHWQRINHAVRQALEGITLADFQQQLPATLVQLGSGGNATLRA